MYVLHDLMFGHCFGPINQNFSRYWCSTSRCWMDRQAIGRHQGGPRRVAPTTLWNRQAICSTTSLGRV